MIALLFVFGVNFSVPMDSVLASFQRTEFRPIARLESLPSGLNEALAEVTHRERVANPNQKWEPTDNLMDPSLPRRRLILAGLSKNMSFVCYEHGGRGKHRHLLLFSGNARVGYRLVGNFSISDGPADIKGLKAAVANGNASPAPEA